MAPRSSIRQRRLIATGAVLAATLIPLVPATSASAASLCAPPADTVAPQLSKVSFDRHSVDLDSGSRTVTVTAQATDTSGSGAPSGVKEISLDVVGPRTGEPARLSLSSGTATDGTWTGSFTIPKTARPGAWQLSEVRLDDADGNFQDYSYGGSTPDSPDDIGLQTGWDTSLTVTGTPATPPAKAKAGKLETFGFSPQSVTTTHAAKRVHVTAQFGAPHPTRVLVYFTRYAGSGRPQISRARLRHGTGGDWMGRVLVHRWSGDSKVHPRLFVEYGNGVSRRFKNISSAQLHARHFTTRLSITSGVDHTKPVLTALRFSPSSVDTTSGAQTVTVTAHAEDAKSGVARVGAELSIHNGDTDASPARGLYPYAGFGYATSDYRNVTLTRNGDTDTWVGTTVFHQCVPSGSWHVRMNLNDKAENFASYTSRKLTAAGLPDTLAVTSTPGDVEPPSVRDATASGADHTITLDFTEGVKTVDAQTLSVYALAPAAERYRQTSDISGIVCSNGSTVIDCSGADGLVTSAVLAVPDVSGGKSFTVFANLDAITPQLTDGTGNPLDWDYQAAGVTGS